MPLYLFKNPENGEIKEIVMSMNDIHEYSENGVPWDRVFTVPQASVDTNIDPFSREKFLEKTAKAGTVGDLWDRSKELSIKREEKRGKDEVKEKFYSDYSKERGGRMHPAQRAEKLKGEIVV